MIAAEAGLVRVMQSGVPAHTGGMPVRLHHIVVDAHDLPGLARFWAQALGWKVCPSASVRSSSGLSAALSLTVAEPADVQRHCVVKSFRTAFCLSTGVVSHQTEMQ